MRASPIPVVGGSYADETRPYTEQDTVGWIPTGAEGEGTRSAMFLKDAPGLQEFATVGTKHRGARDVEGKPLIVSGTGLYQVNTSTGASAFRGTIPGNGRVSMTHNQIAGGNEVLIVNGSAGYIYKTTDLSLTRITDPAYPGARFAEYMNHTFLQIEPQGRYAFTSAVDDGLDYNALEQFQGESKPDRIVGHAVANGEYQMFNERSMDHFDYVGVTGELLRNKNIPIDRGCASGDSICLLDNAVFFVGNDGSGYEKRGYEMHRITTHAIEQAWAKCDRSQAFAFAFEDRGYKIWYVTFPDGHTWGYDVSSRLWHRRESYGLRRWRLATLFKSNGRWFGGEYNSGRLFRVDWDYMAEGMQPLIRRRRMGVGHDNQNLMLLEQVELVFDTGGPETVLGPVFALQFDPNQSTAGGITVGGDLPDGMVGDAVNFQYATIGGVEPIIFTYSMGVVPTGTEADGRAITGELTDEGTFSWRVTATDAVGAIAHLDDTCVVSSLPIITGDLEDGEVGVVYSDTLAVSLGVPPYSNLTIIDGALPPGLSANLAVATITVSGDANVTIASDIFSKLTSYYPFDGDATDVHGPNDLVGGLMLAGYEPGKQGDCLSKNSKGYAVLAAPVAVGAGTKLTIGGWFYFDGSFTLTSIFSVGYTNPTDVHNEAHSLLTSPDGTWATSSWANASDNYVVNDPNTAGQRYDFTVQVQDSLGHHANSDQNITIRSPSGNLPGWYFAVAVWEDELLELAVYGEFVAQTTGPRPTPRAAQITHLQVGNQYGASLTPCACDELFFCDDAALTPAEIAWLYNGGAGRDYAEISGG